VGHVVQARDSQTEAGSRYSPMGVRPPLPVVSPATAGGAATHTTVRIPAVRAETRDKSCDIRTSDGGAGGFRREGSRRGHREAAWAVDGTRCRAAAVRMTPCSGYVFSRRGRQQGQSNTATQRTAVNPPRPPPRRHQPERDPTRAHAALREILSPAECISNDVADGVVLTDGELPCPAQGVVVGSNPPIDLPRSGRRDSVFSASEDAPRTRSTRLLR
jgi:hypothetical protein